MPIVIKSSKKLVKIKIDDLVFHVSPLSYQQKGEFVALSSKPGGEPLVNILNASAYLIKNTVKKIEGLVDEDGNTYEVKLEDGALSDETVDDLLNTEINEKLQLTLQNFVNSIPNKIVDLGTNKPIEGVSIIREKARGK